MIGVRHGETTGRIHIPERVGIEIRLLIIILQGVVVNHIMSLDDAVEGIEDVIGVFLAIHSLVVIIRNSRLSDDDVGVRLCAHTRT